VSLARLDVWLDHAVLVDAAPSRIGNAFPGSVVVVVKTRSDSTSGASSKSSHVVEMDESFLSPWGFLRRAGGNFGAWLVVFEFRQRPGLLVLVPWCASAIEA